MITCHNHGHTHSHSTAAESRACFGIPVSSAVTTTAVVRPVLSNRPTEKMLNYVYVLKGDRAFAATLDFDACSRYIDSLKGKPMTAATPVTPPVQPAAVVAAPEPRRYTRTPAQDFIVGMLDTLPDGRYAVQHPDEGDRVTFIRLSRPTKGQYRGAVKFQTQHSDTLELAWVLWPSGSVSNYYRRNGRSFESHIEILLCGYHDAALRYAQLLDRCCCCGKHLTDARSRWYGVGPECEKDHQWIIDRVDESKGEYVAA